jgi:hypothetical protein
MTKAPLTPTPRLFNLARLRSREKALLVLLVVLNCAL